MGRIEDDLPPGRVSEAARARTTVTMPLADQLTSPYWRGGEAGALRLLTCADCGYWNHPPKPRCRRCASSELEWAGLSSPFVLYSFAVAVATSPPGTADLWIPAVVAHADQPDLRVFAEVVDCDVQDLRVGALLDVDFRRVGNEEPQICLPIFRLRQTGDQ
jgi:uncharacterized protein